MSVGMQTQMIDDSNPSDDPKSSYQRSLYFLATWSQNYLICRQKEQYTGKW